MSKSKYRDSLVLTVTQMIIYALVLVVILNWGLRSAFFLG